MVPKGQGTSWLEGMSHGRSRKWTEHIFHPHPGSTWKRRSGGKTINPTRFLWVRYFLPQSFTPKDPVISPKTTTNWESSIPIMIFCMFQWHEISRTDKIYPTSRGVGTWNLYSRSHVGSWGSRYWMHNNLLCVIGKSRQAIQNQRDGRAFASNMVQRSPYNKGKFIQ